MRVLGDGVNAATRSLAISPYRSTAAGRLRSRLTQEWGMSDALIAAVGGLVGALIGAAIPAWLSYIQNGRSRQSADAEAFGPAGLLLSDVDPDRVALNVRHDDTETAMWAEIAARTQVVRSQLLVVAAGHPRPQVRKLAQGAQIKIANAVTSAGWLVRDLREGHDLTIRDQAREDHQAATEALQDLIDASFGR